jgi:phenylacetate-CoA ligase
MINKETALRVTPHELKQAAKWVYALLPERVRFGSDFFRTCEIIKDHERWSPEQLEKFQNNQLKALIRHAYQHVPYYRRLFQKQRFTPDDIKTIHDLEKLPTLSKDDVRNNFNDLTASNIRKKDLVYLSTSGTSGRPVRIYSERRHEWYLDGDAFRWRHFGWGGCTPKNIRATLTANKIPPKSNGQRRLYLYDPVKRLLVLSTYDLNRDNVQEYVKALSTFKPEFLHGFPSALEVLTRFLTDRKVSAPINPKAMFTQSEVVYPWQRTFVENYWGSKIFDWYGMEERVVAAAECEMHSGLHIFSDYCIVEVLRDNRSVSGEDGEIVSTRLDNYAMPLIRYKTGDIGWRIKEKCACGRCFPLLKIVGGRDRNFLVTKNGGMISITIVDIPNATEHIEQFQFVQEKAGSATLKILATASFSDHDLYLVHKDLKQKFGDMMDVTIEFVDKFDRTARGKFPLLIQKLDYDKGQYP